MHDRPPPQASLQLPAACLRYWSPKADAEDPLAETLERLIREPGVHRVRPGLLAVVPTAGDAAVFDAVIACGRRLIQQAKRDFPPGLQLLIFPAEVKIQKSAVQVLPNPLLQDLNHRLPDAAPNRIHLTGYAAQGLEIPRQLKRQGDYQGVSGRVVPLLSFEGTRVDVPPWRNPEVLGRTLKSISRPAVTEALHKHIAEPLLFVSGPLGCGKTRMVWDTLVGQPGRVIWAAVRPRRSDPDPLAFQILRLLLHGDRPTVARDETLESSQDVAEVSTDPSVREDPKLLCSLLSKACERWTRQKGEPIRIVCDNLDSAGSTDIQFLAHLLDAVRQAGTFQLVLVGRRSIPWLEVRGVPRVEVPPAEAAEMSSFGQALFEGLSLPDEVQQRFLEAASGDPFALEEGIVRLVHRKLLRHIYGSFFFRGGNDVDLEPSNRYIQHVEAELGRLGDSMPLRLLACVGVPVPAEALREAVASVDVELPDQWELPFLASGWLIKIVSPWGAGIALTSEAQKRSLWTTLPPETTTTLRHSLGRILIQQSESAEARWNAYRLLSGSPESIPLLLELSRNRGASNVPAKELFDALRREIDCHRAREGKANTEFELLWRLLPLARRLGSLHEFKEELPRALRLATGEPTKFLALASLRADLETQDGRFEVAEETLRSALEVARQTDDRRKALLLIQLGRLLMNQERNREARELFEQLLPVLERQENRVLSSTCLFYLGNLALREHRLEDAVHHHEAALKQRRQQRLVTPVGASLSALGKVFLTMGNYPKALSCYSEAEKLFAHLTDKRETSFVLLGLGRTLSRLGDFIAASQPLRRALALREGRDDGTGEAVARLAVAENHLDLDQADAALREARQAYFRLSLLSEPIHLADSEQLLGRILLRLRRLDEAAGRLREARRRHREQNDELSAAFDQAWLLEIALARDRSDEIERLTDELEGSRRDLAVADLQEMLDFRLFRGLEWLNEHGRTATDPLVYLRRAFDELLRKAGHLPPELRHRFLFQVPAHEAILGAASHYGLSFVEPGE